MSRARNTPAVIVGLCARCSRRLEEEFPMIAVTVAAMFACALALYLLPVLVGAARHVPDLAAVAVINIFLGWTLAGWVIALALALRSVRPAVPLVQVVQPGPPAGL